MRYYFLILFSFITLTACHQDVNDAAKTNPGKQPDSIVVNNKPSKSTSLLKKAPARSDTIRYVDTVIKINSSNADNKELDELNEEKAKEILHKYFIKQGVCEEQNFEELPHAETSYAYDTIYFTRLNNDKYMDAIILYWLKPIHGSGHCYQPKQGMIVSTKKGYRFIRESFMGDFFAIDSIKKEGAVMYGYYFDCGGDSKPLRRYAVHISSND